MTCRFHQVSIRPPEEQGPADMQAIATLKPLKKKEFWRRVNWYCMMNAKDPAEYGEPDGRRQLLQHRLQNWQKVCECKTRECVLEHRTG